MNVIGFVLSAKRRFRGNVGSELFRRFVQPLAPLSLREFSCIGYGALAHNKAMQTDKEKLSCLLLAQKPRQLYFTADQRRYVPRCSGA